MQDNPLSVNRTFSFNKYILFTCSVYGFLLVGIYFSTYQWLILNDWSRDDYSASLLIPFVVLYLLWEKKTDLSQLPSLTSWYGIPVIFAGTILFWVGELGSEFFSQYLSSWLILVGLLWMHLGWKKLKVIGFPIALLIAMFPLPNFIHGKLSLKLKLISSQLGVKFMQWMGMSAYREGNIIDLGFTQLQVVDACNGLRYLIPLIILGLIIAYFYKTTWWKRLLLVASTIPIAVLVNSLRITSVGVLYPIWGAKVAEGFFHDFSGWFIFMLTVGFLLIIMFVLKQIPPKDTRPIEPTKKRPVLHSTASGAKHQDQTRRHPLKSKHFIAACCLLGFTLALSYTVEFHEQIPISKPFSDFPSTVADWKGKRHSIDQKFLDELDLSDYLMLDFKNGDGRYINLYVAYYETQRKGESIHSPATCMPAGGWVFQQSGKASVSRVNGAPTIPVKRAFMQKGQSKQLSYFWFPMRGRVLTNAYEMKLFNFWDALTQQRTDGALVRLITPIEKDEKIEDADARLQDFTRELVPVLNTFLPQ